MALHDDFRFALRTLRKSPSFTVTAILALAAGIGANVAIFSMVDALLLRPLQIRDSARVVEVFEEASWMGFPQNTPAPANMADWKRRNHVFTDMAATRGDLRALTGDGQPQQVEVTPMTANLLPLLGVAPWLGRNFTAAEDQNGGPKVVLLSYALWTQRYGGEPQQVGRDILLDGVKYRVIGVMPRGFVFPRGSDLWVPMAFSPADWAQRGNHFLHVFARLRPGVGMADAQRDMSAIALQLQREYPETNARVGAGVVGVREELLGKLDLAMRVLAGGVGIVLLICCANVAGLLLARAAGKRREIAVRAALGAGRWALIRQSLAESLVVAAAGAGLGVLVAAYGMGPLGTLVPDALRGWARPEIDARLLLFAAAAAILSAAIFGSLPAASMARADLALVLNQGGRAIAGSGSRLRSGLVVGEVALAVVLSTAAGLMVRTVWALVHADMGFQPAHVMTLRTNLPTPAGSPYSAYQARANFYQQVVRRVEGLPGVVAAGYTTFLPLTNRGGTSGFLVEDAPPPAPGHAPDANHRVVSGDYFRAVGMRLVAGRYFDQRDTPASLPVAIINEASAREFWPGRNPLGRRFRLDGDRQPWLTVVGVVADVKQMGLDLAGRAENYYPVTQPYGTFGYYTPRDLAVRVKGDPLSYAGALRQAVWSVDPNQPVADVQPLEALVDRELAVQRAQLWLLGGFAALALLLAAIGLYGLLAHLVARRTRDIGVRMALGASRTQVLRSILRQGFGLVGGGLVLGTAGALAATQAMRKLLYDVQPADPGILGLVALTLLAVAALACYAPASRAARIQPMEALRQD
ncbi:MAG TPA: ABC transporter permease [Bryobacteraceae bacterium]|nr:ABC transporter permease [Bryobacteraceae bacterium]